MSKTFKNISVEDALESSMAVDGFRCLTLNEEKFPGLAALRSEVQQAIQATQEIKAIIKSAHIAEEVLKAGQLTSTTIRSLKPLAKYIDNNALFDYCNAQGLQERLFDVLEEGERQPAARKEENDPAKDTAMEGERQPAARKEENEGWKLVSGIWSTQMRTVPADLIHRPKPNPWTDGAAKDAHVDSHGKRVLTEYIVDSARLADFWKHSEQFQDLVALWMSSYFPGDALGEEASLMRLTRDMRRFRHHHTFVEKDGRVAPMLQEDVEEEDKEPSTFWSAFELVPREALSFWWNVTPSEDELVAKALAFCDPKETEEVEDRAATRRPMPSRPGAGGIKWATHTLSGPELVPKPNQEYKVVRKQPFGMVTVFDTRVAPHVAEVDDDRLDAIRVSLEARKLTFAVNTNAWSRTI